MAWYLVQAGAALYAMGTDGSSTALTMPTGVSLHLARKMRTAILNRALVVVNAPTRNTVIQPDGTIHVLVPMTPAFAPTAAAGASTGLTGRFRVKYSYAVKDAYGRIVAESPLSPYAEITLANTGLALTDIGTSLDSSVNCRIIYRTTTGGEIYFRWVNLDDNVVTAYDNNLADAGLSLLPKLNSSLGVPPGSAGGTRMRLITEWKNRLWSVSDDPGDVDNLRYSGALQGWAWPTSNLIPIPRVGATTEGITALMPRRDDMVVFKRNSVHKITGDDDTSFQRVVVTEGAGLVAPDSVQVIRNIGYGLGEDGVYQYDDDGFVNISREEVSEWFESDTYFNRSQFPYAEGHWNPDQNSYDLHLAAAGSTVLDRWVSYDLSRKKWLGPHKTDAFTPKSVALVLNSSGSPIPLVGGSDGFVYTMNNAARTDGTSTAIDFDVSTIHTANTPDIEKQFMQMDVLSKVEAAGTLSVTPTVGGLDAAAQSVMSYDLTLGRQRGVFIGPGRILQLRWRHNTNAQDVTIYGAELPYFELGRK